MKCVIPFIVLQRERWMAKVPEPQAIQKLLHTRKTKLPTDDEVCAEEKVAESNQVGANAETILSKYWEERKKSEKPRKPLITGLLPNKYQPEPVVTKIAFAGKVLMQATSLVHFCTL